MKLLFWAHNKETLNFKRFRYIIETHLKTCEIDVSLIQKIT